MPVNLLPYMRFVRSQGGDGCWGYAGCAVWDILNELTCPNCPNMSMNLWLMLHRRRDLWETPANVTPDGRHRYQTPDGRYHSLTNPEFGFFQSFGNSTEGTEPTIPSGRWVGNYTDEGCNEAYNYRLKAEPTKITVSSQKFREELDKKHPIRLCAGPHFVAIVAYDEINQTFTYVDSATYADRTGIGTLTFDDIDQQKAGIIGQIWSAEIFEIIPPRPVPSAIIHVSHKNSRINVNLWLSAEGSPHPARKIWPAWEWTDNDRQDLNFKVRLPTEFIWPPSASNRLVLDIYDSGAINSGGGEIIEFNAAFGAHVMNCTETLNQGPIAFKAGEHRRLYLP